MLTGIEKFEAALDDNPTDWETRLVYADLLEDLGEPVLAAGQRWQAENEKHPEQVGPWFCWWAVMKPCHATIGRVLKDAVGARSYGSAFVTRSVAEIALAQALEATCNS